MFVVSQQSPMSPRSPTSYERASSKFVTIDQKPVSCSRKSDSFIVNLVIVFVIGFLIYKLVPLLFPCNYGSHGQNAMAMRANSDTAEGAKELEGPDDLTKELERASAVIVMFYAHWCPHCKDAMPELDKLSTMSHVPVTKIEHSKCDQNTYDKYGVSGFPTILMLRSDGSATELPRTASDMMTAVENTLSSKGHAPAAHAAHAAHAPVARESPAPAAHAAPAASHAAHSARHDPNHSSEHDAHPHTHASHPHDSDSDHSSEHHPGHVDDSGQSRYLASVW
jgi:thiol-disulfide isomerase/thioredoxin